MSFNYVIGYASSSMHEYISYNKNIIEPFEKFDDSIFETENNNLNDMKKDIYNNKSNKNMYPIEYDENIRFIWQDDVLCELDEQVDIIISDIWQNEVLYEWNKYIDVIVNDTWLNENDVVYDDNLSDDNFSDNYNMQYEISSILMSSSTLTISPTTNWTNIPASGATRSVTVTTNLNEYTVTRPAWTSFETISGGFKLTAQVNTIASMRTGTVSVSGGGIIRNFTVSQLAASPFLTISPTTNWTNIPVIGATRNITVTTNLTEFTITRSAWINYDALSGGFKLTVPTNSFAIEHIGIVNVSGGGINRSFNVSQQAASPTLTISPTTNWDNISASGATRTVTVNTNLPTYTISGPAWINQIEFITGGFKITASINTTTSERTSTMSVFGSGITRNFVVSQLTNNSIQIYNRIPIDIDLPVGYNNIF